MENTQSLIVVNNKIDTETGLVVGSNYEASSGFVYLAGIREVGELRIIEKIGRGTACNILTGLLVYDSQGILLFDARLDKQTYYSRELVKEKVLEGLLEMIRQACTREGRYFNRFDAEKKLLDMLDNAYYKSSYEAILTWAESIGII